MRTAEAEQAAAQEAQRKARDKKIADAQAALAKASPAPAPAKKAAKEAEPAPAKKAAKEAQPAAAKKAPAEAKKQPAPVSGNGKDGQVCAAWVVLACMAHATLHILNVPASACGSAWRLVPPVHCPAPMSCFGVVHEVAAEHMHSHACYYLAQVSYYLR